VIDRDAISRRIRQPASAAIAGIIFAVVLIVVIVMLRSAVPAIGLDAGTWADDPARRQDVDRALNLIPFAGIAFLWFIGVIRAQVGVTEDRFVGTVFLGSGLLFVAMLFTAASSLKAILSLQDAGVVMPVELRAWGWALAATLLGAFGARMAAVFIATVATIGRRSGTLPRWLTFSGYAITILLLLTPPFPTLVQFLFPGWVFALSVYMLTGRHRKASALPIADATPQ
jgi:hypothetical protein